MMPGGMTMYGDTENRIGQQVGNYRLLRLLGQGGFADVFLGEHIYLETQAAIKILRVRLSDEALVDFLHEARTIAKLEHPHIVRVYECDTANSTPFLVMTYAPNGSLRQRHPRGTRLSPTQIVSYIQQIASALQYAHQRKLIHRDIKPENMLIRQDEQVLLSDFGLVLIAQSSGSQTAKEMAGTVPYMAPEQLQGRPRLASDQYALGVVTYEWICGERPFTGSFVEIASQHVLTPPPSLCEKVPGLPPDIESVVFKALAKDPTQRFENISAFAQALTTACANVPSLLTGSSIAPYNVGQATPLPPSILTQKQASNMHAGSQFAQPTYVVSPSSQAQLPYSSITPQARFPISAADQPTALVTPAHPIVGAALNPANQPTSMKTFAHPTPTSIIGGNYGDPSVQSTTIITPSHPIQLSTWSVSPDQSDQSTGIMSARTPTLPWQTMTMPASPTTTFAPIQPARRPRRLRLAMALLSLLVVFIGGSIGSFTWLNQSGQGGKTGAGSATIMITPDRRALQKTYTIVAVTGTPDAAQYQVQARWLSVTTQPQSNTANVTGTKTTAATQATGMLTFHSVDSFSSPTGTTFQASNGVTVVQDQNVNISSTAGGNQTVTAHVFQSGVVGNIPANSVLTSIQSPGGNVTVTNDTAFTGGQVYLYWRGV
jgi:serine/threonine protein kinase